MRIIQRTGIIVSIIALLIPASMVFASSIIPATGGGGPDSGQAANPNQSTRINTNATALGCTLIDTQWKRYGRNILGADQKVSDVVLNACSAIGGISECHFNSGYRSPAHNAAVGGAKNSQHMYHRAIDLRVPKAKEKQFITLAVCGLQKVNNCQGGIGFYSSGAIHIDVRQGTSNVWSNNFSRSSIATKVGSAAVRKVLYGFGDGKCTSGSIQGSYGESKRYGPPVKYTPPKGFPSWFNPHSYGVQNTPLQDIINTLFQRRSTPSNGTSILSDNPFSIQPTTATDTNTQTPYTDTTNANTNTPFTTYTPDPNGLRGIDYVPIGSDNVVTCKKTSLFGIGIFNSCANSRGTAVASKRSSVSSRSSGRTTRALNVSVHTTGSTSVIPQTGITTASQNTVNTYPTGVANSSNTGPAYTPQTYTDRSTFVSGTPRKAVQKNAPLVKDTVVFAKRSILFGIYYGLLDTVSPIVAGGMPRALWQVGEYSLKRGRL